MHFFAIPALINALAWITPSNQPGHPNKMSYATHSGFFIFKPAFSLEAKLGSVST
jgi:hypothetical protein